MEENSQTRQFFDTYAPGFDALYGTGGGVFQNILNRYLRRSMRLRYEMTIAACDPVAGASVLDIGCGPGHYCTALAQKGFSSVCGIDFAESMIAIARKRADREGVAAQCRFITDDFMTYAFDGKFDYSIVMGFMDYVEHPGVVISRVLELTRHKAFFSFPVAGGFLAWQRKKRYRKRCPLYMYNREQVASLFSEFEAKSLSIEKISRDYFVSVEMDRN